MRRGSARVWALVALASCCRAPSPADVESCRDICSGVGWLLTNRPAVAEKICTGNEGQRICVVRAEASVRRCSCGAFTLVSPDDVDARAQLVLGVSVQDGGVVVGSAPVLLRRDGRYQVVGVGCEGSVAVRVGRGPTGLHATAEWPFQPGETDAAFAIMDRTFGSALCTP
jgi:hypothetical protein